MRSSTREAARFGNAAAQLRTESSQLEARLVTVNRELSLAREFLAAQSRELDYLGRAAAERISEHAGRLQALISDNGVQVDAIAGVSQTALANMTELRDNLPVIANSARDVTNQIGGAGRSAKSQLAELIAGFERLNEFGQASERQVGSLRERIDGALTELGGMVDDLDTRNAARLQSLRDEADTVHSALEEREGQALARIRQRGEALRDELIAAHDARQLEEAAALAAMRGRIAGFTREAHDAAAAVRAAERAAVEAWEGQIGGLRERLKEALNEVGTLDQQFLAKAQEKLAELTREAEAMDLRLGERDRAFDDRIAERQAAFEAHEIAALAKLDERARALDTALSASHQAQIAQIEALGQSTTQLEKQVAQIDEHLGTALQRGVEAEHSMAASAERFAATVGSQDQQLTDAELALARLTDASVRLLELIQAAASHSRSDLPAAIEGFETRLSAVRENGESIRSALSEAHIMGTDVAAVLAGIAASGDEAIGNVDALRSRLTGTVEEQAAALEGLRRRLADAGSEGRALAEAIGGDFAAAIETIETRNRESLAALRDRQEQALEEVRDALAKLQTDQEAGADQVAQRLLDAFDGVRSANRSLIQELDEGQNARIAALAERIGTESAHAIDRAVAIRTDETIAKLDQATAQSAEVSREAVANLRDQLARLHELTVNLETRAARAREQVEEQVDNDFSRRMALITESLNSHSIDIAKALSTEVTDTAWASYLKGDRGVFTRRAVKLMDAGDSREISALYEGDHEFRDHVSRYIHDFEAMLRTMLSTRDGHALGVTMLSSDMGKLYVALAQAIQRLRQ